MTGEGLFQDPDTEDQVPIKEEAGKTWGKETNAEACNQIQREASEKESEARV